MKKLIIACSLILTVVFSGWLFADNIKQSTQYALSTNVYSGPGFFYGMLINKEYDTGVTLDVYDNTVNSGTRILPQMQISSGQSVTFIPIILPHPIQVTNGVYVHSDASVVGGCTFVILWRDR